MNKPILKNLEKTEDENQSIDTSEGTKTPVDFVKEFRIEDVWTTGCALNTTGKIDN